MGRTTRKTITEIIEENNPIETSIENVRRKYDLDLSDTFDLLFKYIYKKTRHDDEIKQLVIDDLKFILFD